MIHQSVHWSSTNSHTYCKDFPWTEQKYPHLGNFRIQDRLHVRHQLVPAETTTRSASLVSKPFLTSKQREVHNLDAYDAKSTKAALAYLHATEVEKAPTVENNLFDSLLQTQSAELFADLLCGCLNNKRTMDVVKWTPQNKPPNSSLDGLRNVALILHTSSEIVLGIDYPKAPACKFPWLNGPVPYLRQF